MEVRPRFQKTVDSLFHRLGMTAEYWPASGELPFELRVIPQRPHQIVEVGEAHIHAEDAQFGLRVEDVPVPHRGDDIHFLNHIYRIESEPRLERHQLVWMVDTLPL